MSALCRRLFSIVVAFTACDQPSSSNTNQPSASDPDAACQQLASQCGYEPHQVAECKQACADGLDNEGCWFSLCSAETGLCDNEEPGDPSILACAERHGWHDAPSCDDLISLCGADGSQVSECEAACARDVREEACWFAMCSVITGYCDNEEPGDPTILECAEYRGWRD